MNVRLSPIAVSLIMLSFPSIAFAQGASQEIECVYAGLEPADILLAFDAEQRGDNQPHSNTERSAETRIIDKVTACVRQYHWVQAQAQASVQYATGRIVFDRAIRTMREHGIDQAILEQVAVDLGAQRVASLASGSLQASDAEYFGRAVIRRLQAAHYPVPLGNDAELARLGGYFGEALAARALRDSAIVQFGRP